MLHVPVGANSFGLTTPSWGTSRPAAANGTSVTPNAASDAYGTIVTVGADLLFDSYGLVININSNSGSNASRNTAVQIYYDPAGGTSWTPLVGGLLCGSVGTYAVGGGSFYYFPLLIPAGSSIGAAARGSVATAIRVGVMALQKPPNPSLIRKGSFTETLGVTLGTGTAVGTTVVPGTTSDGAWTAIGTTTNRMWWWQIGMQLPVGDTGWGAVAYHVDIGVGDPTTPDIIIQDFLVTTTTTEQLTNLPTTFGVEWDVPAGSTLYARIQNSGANETGNTTIAIYGCGG